MFLMFSPNPGPDNYVFRKCAFSSRLRSVKIVFVCLLTSMNTRFSKSKYIQNSIIFELDSAVDIILFLNEFCALVFVLDCLLSIS